MAAQVRVKCVCGKVLRVPAHLQGKRVECPACGGVNLVAGGPRSRPTAPPGAPSPSRRTIWIALISLFGLLVVGGVIALIATSGGDEPEPRKNGLPPVVAARKLAVVVDRIEPGEPRAGESATVYLREAATGKPAGLTFQYRASAAEPWRTAAEGRFILSNLRAGTHSLEARALDASDNVSPIATVTLVVARSPLELQLRTGHSSLVTRTALSGDGKYLITGSTDKTAILWETATGQGLLSFEGHAGSVGSVAISDDARYVVTGSEDKTAMLWDTASGKRVQTFEGNTHWVTSVALSGDGRHLATGSKEVIVWDAVAGKKIQAFGGIDTLVTSLAITGDGKFVATAGDFHKAAILWDATSGKKLQEFRGDKGWISSVAVSDDGRYLATACSDNTVTLWEVAGSKKLQTFRWSAGVGQSVCLSRDGKYVAMDLKDQAVLCETTSGRTLHTLPGLLRGNNMLSRDGTRLATQMKTGSFHIWDAATGNELRAMPVETIRPVTTLALSGDGRHLVTGSQDHSATLWNLSEGKKAQAFNGHTELIVKVGVSGDGKRVLTGANDQRAILWDAGTGDKLKTYSVPRIWSVALSGDGRTVLTSSAHGINGVLGQITVASADGKTIGTFPSVPRAALSHDGRLLLTATYPPILWSTADGKILKMFDVSGDITSVALSDSENYVVTGSARQAILWEAGGRKIRALAGIDRFVSQVAVTADGQLVVGVGEYEKTAILWDTTFGEPLHTLVGHSNWITGVALSGDGKHLWTSSADGSTRLWDPATGRERCRLYSLSAGTEWLVVTPEGYFDASPGGRRLVGYRMPGSRAVVDDEATLACFHRPGLLADICKK